MCAASCKWFAIMALESNHHFYLSYIILSIHYIPNGVHDITGLDPECPHVPGVSYQTKNSSKGDFYSFDFRRVTLNQAEPVVQFIENKAAAGTFKYGYFFRYHEAGYVGFMLIIRALKTGNEYMLYEGVGCMYGGLYIVIFSSIKRSRCIQSVESTDFRIRLPRPSSIILIHYSSYTDDTIIFRAYYKIIYGTAYAYPLRPIIKGDTARFFVTRPKSKTARYLQPFWMDLRGVRYVDIKVIL